MKRMSFRKISILGVVLMTASAVTAAIIPAKSESKMANDGTLKPDLAATTDGYTCVVRTGAASCTLNDSGGPTSAPANGSSINSLVQNSLLNTSRDFQNYFTSVTQ